MDAASPSNLCKLGPCTSFSRVHAVYKEESFVDLLYRRRVTPVTVQSKIRVVPSNVQSKTRVKSANVQSKRGVTSDNMPSKRRVPGLARGAWRFACFRNSLATCSWLPSQTAAGRGVGFQDFGTENLTQIWLKPRPESGFDWLICAEFAVSVIQVQGHLAHKKQPPPLGLP